MRRAVLFFLAILGGIMPAQGSSVCVREACVHVELARTLEELQRGLQGKEGLAENEGMLFIFDSDDFQRFWMKDMKFSIDMIWLDNQKHIVTMAPSRLACVQEPCTIYSPSEKARYVLEVPAGFALKHQLKQGDVFEFKGIH